MSNVQQGILNVQVLHHWMFLVGYSSYNSPRAILPAPQLNSNPT
jgi:hypothetical protein